MSQLSVSSIMARFLLMLALFVFQGGWALGAPDWAEHAPVSSGGRANPYNLPPLEFEAAVVRGRTHALWYPVEVTGILVPYEPFRRFSESRYDDPLKRFLSHFFRGATGIRSVADVYDWLGIHRYPDEEPPEVTSPYYIPRPPGWSDEIPMGLTLVERAGQGKGFTFSCATCHSSNLFGRPVLGMTNRFPRANHLFVVAKNGVPLVHSHFFREATEATEGERRMFLQTKKRLRAVGVKNPTQLGLDTSLAQVALSLARRGSDEYARLDPHREWAPEPEILESKVVDSKPAVWWNLKYKNRWLSDGSVVSGNPIFTNILWNEIGRGTDLEVLEGWLVRNDSTVRDLTTAVFSSEAPRFTDFFSAETIDLTVARRGEVVFKNRCARCHGQYDKAWNELGSDQLSLTERLETVRVHYHEQTPVINVGTDPSRAEGMTSLEKRLNPLAISKSNGTVIKSQNGYVPPPLVGIWARWPYFHNNSAPSLCAVLTPASDRPVLYWAGPAEDPARDFDRDCNGYPSGAAVPAAWKQNSEYAYDARRRGLSNRGHDEGILTQNGRELMTPREKHDLIVFLQTL